MNKDELLKINEERNAERQTDKNMQKQNKKTQSFGSFVGNLRNFSPTFWRPK